MAEPHKVREPRKYHIVREIGRGGMGTVYEVTHRLFTNRRRAVKVLNPELAGRRDFPSLLDRFTKEAVRMAKFEHPHIVRVHEIEEEEGFGTYIVMDLIEGRSLHDILRPPNPPLPYLEVLRIGSEIASALDVAHRANIIHRDIKAQNILIETATGRAVLTDFGIAKEIHREGEETVDGTNPGHFVGTVRYACPEQFFMARPHPRWDIYALGAVLYEALSGHTFLKDIPFEEIPQRVVTPTFEPRLDYPQPPPEDFDRLVLDCLHRDAAKRISSAEELLRRIEACRESYLALHAEQETEEARRSLREEIQRKVRELEALQANLGDVGASAGDGTRAPELSSSLREVTELEEAGRYREALARLETLSERAARAERRSQHIAHDEFERAIDGFAKRWDTLHQHATPWLPAPAAEQFEALLARLRRSLADGEWNAVAQDINDAPSLIARIETTARAAAESAAGAALAAIETASLALRGLDPSAVPRDLDLDALRARVAAHMQEQQFDAAVHEADSERARVEAALQQVRQVAEQRVLAARSDAERARQALDPEVARAIAPDELAAAEEGFAAAAGEADAVAAVSQFGRVAAAFRALAGRVSARQEEELAALAEELRSAIAAATGEPDVVVGAARRAGEAALKRDGGGGGTLTAIRHALAALTAARGELPAFRAADASRTAAQTAQQRASTTAAAHAELRAAAELMREAGRSFEARHWDEARARYDEAAATWSAIEQRAAALAEEERRRRLQARCVALREELTAGGATLELLMQCAGRMGARVEAPVAEDIRHAAAEGSELERSGALERALERFGGARERLTLAEAAFRGALASAHERAAAQLAARWGELTEQAAGLVTPALRQQYDRHAAAPARAAAAGDWQAVCDALDAARVWLDGCEIELRATARRALNAPLAALATAVESLRQSGGELPAGIDAERVEAEVAAALAANQFQAAEERVDNVWRQVDAALEEQRGRLKAMAGAAHAALEEVLGGLDLDAARAVAKQPIDEGSRARKDAAAAERRQDWQVAAAAYERAATAFRTAADQLGAARRQQVAVAAAALEQLVQRAAAAPADLVGETVQRARAALAGVPASDPVAALAAVERAREKLGRALDEAGAFAAAQAECQAAEEVARGLGALQLSAQEREAATAVLLPAAQAFERRAWLDATARYGEARRQLEQLTRSVTSRVAAERAGAEAREVARGALRDALARTADQPDELVGEARRAAEQLHAAATASPGELDAARAALLAASAQSPRYQAAAQQRAAARDAADRTRAVPYSQHTLKRSAKLVHLAAAAMAARRWEEAAQRYGQVVREYETPQPVPPPTRRRAIAGAAAALLLVAIGWWVVNRSAPQAPALPARIASASPADEAVTVRADATERFSIELAPGASTSDIEWVFAGKSVEAARGQTAWKYTPDASDVGGPYQLALKLGAGSAPDQKRSWSVTVVPAQVVKAAPIEAAKPVAIEPAQPAPIEAAKPPPVEAAKPAPIEEAVKPPPPPPAVPQITAAEPRQADVTVAEGSAQRFAVQLADAGGSSIEWLFDGKTVSDARGRTMWQYTPDFAAAGGPRPLTVRVGDGPNAAVHSWNVSVSDVNRPPVVKSDPPAGNKVVAERGSTKRFKVIANDDDGDALTYAWTIDGKPAGQNQPSLDLPVTGSERVALAVSDGKMKDPIRLEWPLDVAPGTLAMSAQPAALKTLQFKASQQFKLVPPAGASTPIQIAWAVDGKKVSDGPTFTFTPEDAALVRPAPVRIDATAHAANGGEFTYNWRFAIQPPPPQIEAFDPSQPSITATDATRQRFRLDAASPIGNQSFSYVFALNGKETQSSTPSFEFTPATDKDYTVVASIRDNYGQRSSERSWTIRGPRSLPPVPVQPVPPEDPSTLVQAWLDTYRNALLSQDVPRICTLLALSSDKCAALAALPHRDDLDVRFNNVKIEPSGADGARATYVRRDNFLDPSGKNRSQDASVTQCFHLVGGQVQIRRCE